MTQGSQSLAVVMTVLGVTTLDVDVRGNATKATRLSTSTEEERSVAGYEIA